VIAAELRRVTKRFGATTALDGIDLEVAEGDTLALLGPNGAGKTTALALLLGLRRPDAGTARLYGLDPRTAEARWRVAMAPQETTFPPTLRVGELIGLVRCHHPHPAPLSDLCEAFALTTSLRRQLGALSLGERRRLAVALAFAGGAELVVLDEPTAGLDAEGRRSVWTAISGHAEKGGTTLFTTHHLDEAEALARRLVLLDAGVVVASGGVSEIKATAGRTRVSYRASGGGLVHADVGDAGAYVEELVRRGTRLTDLEVRPLTLEEALMLRTTRR
jgi:ABC-2 type transport system ATP-binding protein